MFSLTRRFVSPHHSSFHLSHLADVYPQISRLQWSGAEYADNLLMTITGGISSTAAMGKGVTEDQFGKKH